jgi:hypothetical protein
MPSIKDYIANLKGDKRNLVELLNEKSVTASDSETFTELIVKANALQPSTIIIEKDVNFYDYDGKLLYSYYKNDFLNLTELPSNPTHTGLTAQGWNWTLQGAKAFVTTYGYLDIGQNYITENGDTLLDIDLINDNVTITLKYNQTLSNGSTGGTTVDWGDGTEAQFVGYGGNKVITHTYSSKGKYTISILPNSDVTSYVFGYISGQNYPIITANDSTYPLKKVFIGSKMTTVNSQAFRNSYNLETIIMPKTITTFGNQLCDNCYMLKSITFPSACEIDMQNSFQNCINLNYILFGESSVQKGLSNIFTNIGKLKRFILVTPNATLTSFGSGACSVEKVIIPNGVETFGTANADILGSFVALKSITFPTSLTAIGDYVSGAGAYSLKTLSFKGFTQVPTLGNYSLINLQPDAKILVPSSLYSSWIASTNWSSSSIVGKIYPIDNDGNILPNP